MILICVALEKELPNEFKQRHPDCWMRTSALKAGGYRPVIGRPFIILITGVGQQAKESLRIALATIKPTEIVNMGTAGSSTLSKDQWVMLRSTEFENSTIDCAIQTALPIPYHTFLPVKGQTTKGLNPDHWGECLDMESFHLAKEALNANTPFCSFKYITDGNNHQTMTEFNDSLPSFHESMMLILNHFFVKPVNFSVIIPVFNRPEALLKAIKSVENQSLSPLEIVVIDDGSKPPIFTQSPGVTLIRLKKNRGVSAARNRGILATNGDWLLFLDSDDEWEPHHISSLVAYINKNPMCRILQTDERWIRHGQPFNKKKHHKKPGGWAYEASLLRCLVSPSAVMMHRSLFNWHGYFDESLPVCEDYDLWLRILRYHPVGLVDSVSVTKYGGHGDQLSVSEPAMDKFRVQSLIKQFNNESVQTKKAAISRVMQTKLDILIQGAKKRSLMDNLTNYHDLKQQLNQKVGKLILKRPLSK